MVEGMVIAMLTVETVSDVKMKKVSAVRIAVFLLIGIAINAIKYYQSIWSMLGGMAVGATMFLYAFLTKESIGYGDCLIFVCAGMYIGFSKNIRLLFFSLLAAAMVGGVCILARKRKMKTKMPFVPYILGTYVVMTILDLLGGIYAIKW